MNTLGKLSISISEDLETQVREIAWKKYQGKKGSLSKIVEKALVYWLENMKEKP